MLQVIGIMVGMYILTWMIDLLSRRSNNPRLGLVGVFAILTILVTLGSMLYLLLGADLAKGLVGIQ